MSRIGSIFAALVGLATFAIVGSALLGAVDALRQVPGWVWVLVNPITLTFAYYLLSGDRDITEQEAESNDQSISHESTESEAGQTPSELSPEEWMQQFDSWRSEKRARFPLVHEWRPIRCMKVGPIMDASAGEEVSFDVQFGTRDVDSGQEWGVNRTFSGRRTESGVVVWNHPFLSRDFLLDAMEADRDLAGVLKFVSILVEPQLEDESRDKVCILWCYRIESLGEALTRAGYLPRPNQDLEMYSATFY